MSLALGRGEVIPRRVTAAETQGPEGMGMSPGPHRTLPGHSPSAPPESQQAGDLPQVCMEAEKPGFVRSPDSTRKV